MSDVRVLSELKHLIPKFLENRKSEIESAKTLVNQADFVALDRYGHSLKGVCLSYGFVAVVPLASEIQAAAKAQSKERVLQAVEQVRGFFSSAQIHYVDAP